MELALSDDETSALTGVLNGAISDLSMEIADTDNPGFRAGLTSRRDHLRAVRRRIGGEGGGASEQPGAGEPRKAVLGRPTLGLSGPEGAVDLVEIAEEECYDLLKTQNLGRLAVNHDGQPVILPLNYGIDERTVVVRTASGEALSYAPMARVAFEVEEIDAQGRSGWVVVVQGFAEDISDTIDQWSEHVRSTPVHPWVAGQRDGFIAITRGRATGRRIHPARSG